MLGSLAACELATLRTYTSRGPLKVNRVKFTRIESSYSAEKFLKGGPENKMDDIFIEAEVHTNGTQADLDAIHEKVTNSCPVYQTFKAAGVNIHNTWKNIQTSEWSIQVASLNAFYSKNLIVNFFCFCLWDENLFFVFYISGERDKFDEN